MLWLCFAIPSPTATSGVPPRREDVGALVDAPVRAGLAPVVGEGDGTRDRTDEIHHGDPGGEARIRGRRLFLGRWRGRCRGGRGGGRGCGGRGLLGGDGLVVPVEGLLLFGDLEIARDDGERVAQLLGVLVRLGDERVLPLPRGRHRVAVGLELLPVLVELVHLGVGALLRRVGEARDASAGDEVAGRADLAEHGEAGSAPTSIEHCGPVREQFLQLRDPGLETRDPLLEDGDALVEALELRVRVDVRLRRGVGVDPGLRDLGPLGLDLRVRGDRRGRRGGRPGRNGRARGRRSRGAGRGRPEMERAEDDRQRDQCSARRVLPCHPEVPSTRPGASTTDRHCAAQTEPSGDQFVEVVGTGARRLERHPANSAPDARAPYRPRLRRGRSAPGGSLRCSPRIPSSLAR